ncbi:MAG: putative allantoicase [Myxococcales bacterium]|nr:putative allantoicase [Myxococcales bacterium]
MTTSMTISTHAATFSGLVDLAAAALGGRAVGTNDDFFAEASNLLLPDRAVFIADKFTERGKWMDGWESRRKRVAGHDWCVLALGAPGELVGFDIDTQHFVGNHPPFASVDGLWAPDAANVDAAALLARGGWTELLAQAPLRPDAQNLFAALPRGPVTHVRLNIFPDGGVARFRAFGRVLPTWDAAVDVDAETRARVAPELRDLAAVKNGGLALACSDAFFGPMNNLLLPGRPADMGGGWETRRRRGPGSDWILVQLGARGAAAVVEVDTCHFKGNFPERCALEAIDAPLGARITDLVASTAWRPLVPEARLAAHARHFFDVPAAAPATHVRLNIYPDGGVARLRVWGTRHA